MTTTDHTTDAEYIALLARILETPADDAPRLIIADWLEELGEEERAKEIRHFVANPNLYRHSSIGNVFTTDCRGFISEVRLTCAEFIGGTCERCLDNGEVEDHCPRCSGTGRIAGVARALFERHPIVKVVLTDRECYEGNLWFQAGRWSVDQHPESDIPKALMELMANAKGWDVSSYIGFDTESASLDALSDACVAYGRELAGLPALEVSR